MIENVTEDIALFIVRPEKKVIDIIIRMHFMIKALRPNLVENLIFIPGENHDIIEYMM